MPALPPNALKLSVSNIIKVTQYQATTELHRDAVQELIRVSNMAKQKGSRGKDARDFLFELRCDLLACSDQM